jgi:T3SS (YopN, CesT) and YbjN peptide-binding chaperone 1
MGSLEATDAKLRKYLTSIFNRVEVDGDGDYSVRRGSTRAFFSVHQSDADAPVFVKIHAYMLMGVPRSQELYKYIAFHSDDYIFGHLALREASDGTLTVLLEHILLGDYLDEAEIGYTSTAVLGTADDLDDTLQKRFGGERFHEL